MKEYPEAPDSLRPENEVICNTSELSLIRDEPRGENGPLQIAWRNQYRSKDGTFGYGFYHWLTVADFKVILSDVLISLGVGEQP